MRVFTVRYVPGPGDFATANRCQDETEKRRAREFAQDAGFWPTSCRMSPPRALLCLSRIVPVFSLAMEFLTKINKALFVSKNGVWLVDENAIASAAQTSVPTVPSIESAPADPPEAEESTSNHGGKTNER